MLKNSISFFLIIAGLLCGQSKLPNPANVNREIFFGRQPSARIEATGQTGVTYDNWLNPAVGFEQTTEVFYTYATPQSYWDDNFFNFASLSVGVLPDLKIGAGYQNVCNRIENDDPFMYYSTSKLSAGYQLSDDLIAGTTVNYLYNWLPDALDLVDEFGQPLGQKEYSENAWSVDIGALYNFNLSQLPGNKLIFAVSCQNAIATKLVSSLGNEDWGQKEELPVIFRTGISWEYKHKDNSWSDYSLQLHYQYQDLINSSMRTKHSLGTEITYHDLLIIRGGFYSETGGISNQYTDNFTRNEFTYGIGMKISPDEKFPLSLEFSYAHLPLSDKITTDQKKDNTSFSTFSIGASYKIR